MCLNTSNFLKSTRCSAAPARGGAAPCGNALAFLQVMVRRFLFLMECVSVSSCKAAMYLPVYALRRARAVRVDMVDSAYEIAPESPKTPASQVIFRASMPVADFPVAP